MFGTLGGPELFLIFVVALIVFGPRKLPDIGKSLGRMMAEFRKASNEFRSTIESEVEAEKIRDAMRIEPPRVDTTPSYAAPEPASSTAATASTDAAQPDATDVPAVDEPSPAAPSSPDERVPETVSRQTDPTPIEPK